MKNKVLHEYNCHYGKPSIFIKSPGRANIIGEHTDYNHGLVLPFAIEQSISMVIGENDQKKLRLIALDLNEKFETDLIDISYTRQHWSRYFINSLVSMGHNPADGIDVVFGGDLPQGGGVSSSSALTCGFLAGLNKLFDCAYDNNEIASLASQAENGIGLNGGMMDQMSILNGMENKALLIDFLSFEMREVNVPSDGYSFYLFNSGQKHNLVNTAYNTRRATCESAVRQVRAIDSRVETLRDLTSFHIDTILDGDTVKKRVSHVLQENTRVEAVVTALENGNYDLIGSLLNQSHHSLSQNYEVSTPEIDFLVAHSNQVNNLLGGRIMGGGFGGCTINFVKGELSTSQTQKLKEDYYKKTNLELEIYQIKASQGVIVSEI